MEKIGLAEAIDALRSELAAAVEKAQGQEIQFPIGSVQLEFQVGVTWDTEAKTGVKFWVLELGASGSYANESVQKVTLNLEAPVDAEGRAVKVARQLQQKP
jgi:NTP-dependent ternary system trypsin peptidase co-occuring protein